MIILFFDKGVLKRKGGFTRTPKFGVTPKGGGFTLIELMVVVGIIALLATVVLAVLDSAKSKGNDAGIKLNLKNAMNQGEIFWNTNTTNPNTYTSVCTASGGVGLLFYAAAQDAGVTGTGVNTTNNNGGDWAHATCHAIANAWAAEVPLSTSASGSPVMWCVDSTGKSKQENNNITSYAPYQYACQ